MSLDSPWPFPAGQLGEDFVRYLLEAAGGRDIVGSLVRPLPQAAFFVALLWDRLGHLWARSTRPRRRRHYCSASSHARVQGKDLSLSLSRTMLGRRPCMFASAAAAATAAPKSGPSSALPHAFSAAAGAAEEEAGGGLRRGHGRESSRRLRTFAKSSFNCAHSRLTRRGRASRETAPGSCFAR